jgi:hypothetical protein
LFLFQCQDEGARRLQALQAHKPERSGESHLPIGDAGFQGEILLDGRRTHLRTARSALAEVKIFQFLGDVVGMADKAGHSQEMVTHAETYKAGTKIKGKPFRTAAFLSRLAE